MILIGYWQAHFVVATRRIYVAMDAVVERINELKKQLKESESRLNDLPSNDHPLYIPLTKEIKLNQERLAAEYELLRASVSAGDISAC